mgnify:CR=1 FL=1
MPLVICETILFNKTKTLLIKPKVLQMKQLLVIESSKLQILKLFSTYFVDKSFLMLCKNRLDRQLGKAILFQNLKLNKQILLEEGLKR